MSDDAVVLLDPTKMTLTSPTTHQARTSITASTSPYDVPEALRVYESADGTYVIEVKYIGPEEPLDVADVANDLKIKVGHNSKRLYEFIFDRSSSMTLNALQSAVTTLIHDRMFPRKDNYRLLDDIFTKQSDKIQDILAFTNVKKVK